MVISTLVGKKIEQYSYSGCDIHCDMYYLFSYLVYNQKKWTDARAACHMIFKQDDRVWYPDSHYTIETALRCTGFQFNKGDKYQKQSIGVILLSWTILTDLLNMDGAMPSTFTLIE